MLCRAASIGANMADAARLIKGSSAARLLEETLERRVKKELPAFNKRLRADVAAFERLAAQNGGDGADDARDGQEVHGWSALRFDGRRTVGRLAVVGRGAGKGVAEGGGERVSRAVADAEAVGGGERVSRAVAAPEAVGGGERVSRAVAAAEAVGGGERVAGAAAARADARAAARPAAGARCAAGKVAVDVVHG
jgi:hypothetical protein